MMQESVPARRGAERAELWGRITRGARRPGGRWLAELSFVKGLGTREVLTLLAPGF